MSVNLLVVFDLVASPLLSDIAQQICEVFPNRLQFSNVVDLAEHYWQALPFGPPCKDQNRRTTLDNFRVG